MRTLWDVSAIYRRRMRNDATRAFRDFSLALIGVIALVAFLNLLSQETIPLPLLSLLPPIEGTMLATKLAAVGLASSGAGLDSTLTPAALNIAPWRDIILAVLTILFAALVSLNLWLMRRATATWRRRRISTPARCRPIPRTPR